MGDFTENAQLITSSIAEINYAIDSVARSAEEGARGASEIASNVSETSRAIEGAAIVAQNQSGLAENLILLVKKFEV